MIEHLFGAQHGGYILSAYAITFATLAFLVAGAFATRARRKRRLERLDTE